MSTPTPETPPPPPLPPHAPNQGPPNQGPPHQGPPHQGPPPRPASNAGWAVASLLFFWPLSFAAFNHAFNVFPLWASGDYHGAQYASDRVRRLGQISLWIAGGLFLLFLVLYVVFVIVLVAQHGGPPHHYGPRMR
ncbi:CD225/dispanin family protein [Antrihabitans stalactiti]|uniref:CD225/dispanin family protein n=1 Tax=Antrihabitans stalactiti TaxID=2584121 RepID=A0A848KE03_9NOCA|nr:CD225/dispanin family protein [Antrihabitans stalactiti]NMN96519.1 CD225/dispanin family protein [Antrihabitans stalactiti]